MQDKWQYVVPNMADCTVPHIAHKVHKKKQKSDYIVKRAVSPRKTPANLGGNYIKRSKTGGLAGKTAYFGANCA